MCPILSHPHRNRVHILIESHLKTSIPLTLLPSSGLETGYPTTRRNIQHSKERSNLIEAHVNIATLLYRRRRGLRMQHSQRLAATTSPGSKAGEHFHSSTSVAYVIGPSAQRSRHRSVITSGFRHTLLSDSYTRETTRSRLCDNVHTSMTTTYQKTHAWWRVQ